MKIVPFPRRGEAQDDALVAQDIPFAIENGARDDHDAFGRGRFWRGYGAGVRHVGRHSLGVSAGRVPMHEGYGENREQYVRNELR